MTTVNPTANPAKPELADAGKQAILREIQAKWDKLSPTDIAALKSTDDLVAKVVAKYGQDKSLTQRDVEALLNGRVI